MNENNPNEIIIPLFDEEGNAYSYRLEHIFPCGDEGQMYCSIVSVDDENDVRLLKCSLDEHDDETTFTVFVVEEVEEYEKVAAEYERIQKKAYAEAMTENLAGEEDLISLEDANGNVVNFIAHLIFEDKQSKRSYIALQEIDEVGDVSEEISLYRFREDDEKNYIDMIPSDMEYERARNLFIELLEKD